MKHNFLLTGGCGFIGSHICEHLAKNVDSKVVVLDKLTYAGSLENIEKKDNIEIVVGDYANTELVAYLLEKYEIDIVLHYGAESHVSNSFLNSISFTNNNVLGTHYLLESVRQYQDRTGRLKSFIFAGSDEIFGQVCDNIPRTEEDVIACTNPYSTSKYACELLIKSYGMSYNLPYIIIRMNNIYFTKQHPEKLIPRFICQLLNNEKLTIQGKGDARRDFLHVNDACTALDTILRHGELNNIYNVGSDHSNEYSVMEMAKILTKLIKDDDDYTKYITYVPDRIFNDCRYYISSAKLNKLGWKPTHNDFIGNLKVMIEWYKENKKRYGL